MNIRLVAVLAAVTFLTTKVAGMPSFKQSSPPVEVGAGDKESAWIATGKFTVKRVKLPRCSGRDPSDIVLTPQEAGSYPALVFHHGTALMAADYEELLTHVASHGYVVMAPQIYRPQGLLTTPVAKEQRKASESQIWVAQKLAAWLPPDVNLDLSRGLFVSGHSRGGAIAYLTAKERSAQAPAVQGFIGVDPVDTKEVPAPFLRKSALSLGAAANLSGVQGRSSWRSLVFGTGMGSQPPACAPEGSNHVQFYSESNAPSWHVVGTEAGHMDMLNDHLGWFSSACVRVCKSSGLPRSKVRSWLGGLMVAFMQDTDPSHRLDEFLNSTSSSVPFTFEKKLEHKTPVHML